MNDPRLWVLLAFAVAFLCAMGYFINHNNKMLDEQDKKAESAPYKAQAVNQ